MEDGEEEMDDTADEETVVVVESNGYVEYDAAMVQEATEAGKDVVLFFHADRCPSCRALEEDVNENVSDINENTVLVKVDYDTAEDLKAQYGVTAQHTLVYLDENGEEKMKERGSMTLTEVQANIEG
jgi:thioredoxin-like negative regulator of GroEL